MAKKFKQMTALILAGVVVFNGSSLGASATTQKVPLELEGMYSFTDPNTEGPEDELRGEANYLLPKLKAGNYEKWIDRIELPEYARTFYTMLEEACDNDGIDDFLIDRSLNVSIAEKDDSLGKGIKVAEVRGAGQDWTYAQAVLQNDFLEKKYAILSALEAFDRDHPEVFWLRGSTYVMTPEYNWKHIVNEETGEREVEFSGDFYFMVESEYYDWEIWADKYGNKEAILAANAMVEQRIEEITGTVEGKSAVEQMRYFNQWLTHNNEYNILLADESYEADLDKFAESFECTSALKGSVGSAGPVCEAYARAFKVLCDAVGIPCVLVDGYANSGSGAANHMWNYAQAEGKWYAVDVTWNDPLSYEIGATSGSEKEEYFLLGSKTTTKIGKTQVSFIDSHPAENKVRTSGVGFVNGPVLNETAYDLNGTPKPAPAPTPEPLPELEKEKNPATEQVSKEDVSKTFTDVQGTTWYKDSVQYVYDKGLMTGSNGRFKPQENVKRAQVIVTLYRLAGSPKTRDLSALIDFVDIDPTAYYVDALCWAYSEGIITGTGEHNQYFHGDDAIKRQQLAAILRRYANSMGQETTERTDISHMLNAFAVSSYAIDDMQWAVAAGLLSGSQVKDANGNIAYDLKPHATATRGQLAAILERFCANNGY